jgi:hypothetical protein
VLWALPEKITSILLIIVMLCYVSFLSRGVEIRKGRWLQLDGLFPRCIASPKYLWSVGQAEQSWGDLVERSESKSEMRKMEVGGQGVAGLVCQNVGEDLRQEEI